MPSKGVSVVILPGIVLFPALLTPFVRAFTSNLYAIRTLAQKMIMWPSPRSTLLLVLSLVAFNTCLPGATAGDYDGWSQGRATF